MAKKLDFKACEISSLAYTKYTLHHHSHVTCVQRFTKFMEKGIYDYQEI